MDKLTSRDHVLLGYSARRSFGNSNSLSNTQNRNTVMDFNDVFGGPPRSSIPQVHHSLGEALDSYSLRRQEETPPTRSSLSALGEKPVFGEDSPNRRRRLGGDFFDDIFRGEHSLSSTPKKTDPFASSPSSRVLSPIQPSTPKFETFNGGSSLPRQLSLSSKLAKVADLPTFRTPVCHSPNKNNDSASKAFGTPSSPSDSMQPVLVQDELKTDGRPYRQSPLSYQVSISCNGSSEAAESPSQHTEGQREKDVNSSEVSSESSQFHFSIYKWASKGVTLMMPVKGGSCSNSKDRGKNESGSPAPILQQANLPSLDENKLMVCRSLRSQYDERNDTSTKYNRIRSNNVNEDFMLSKPVLKPLNSISDCITEESGVRKEATVSLQQAFSFELKNLDCQLNDSSHGPGKNEIVIQAGKKDIVLQSNTTPTVCADSTKEKKPVGKKSILNHAKATKPASEDSPLNSQDKKLGNRAKSKVQEFVKIFNLEASPKLASNIDSQGRRKDLGLFKIKDRVPVCEAKAGGKEKISNGIGDRTLTGAPVVVDKVPKQTDDALLDINLSSYKTYGSRTERRDIPATCSGSTPESLQAAIGNLEDPDYDDLDGNCMVEHIIEELKEQPQTDKYQNEIQVSEAKLRQWSNGKEGNIRSLLSTLQYVLWPQSGWKPVPLVDIIEGPSVKRAYQRALLCLHPDKLQQKGAPEHKKYIAEKVYDILQDAWTHYSALSAI